tara:strand:- start:418 stop:675 length:258 start_codon:yes stop_codon:yes gene_type:complete
MKTLQDIKEGFKLFDMAKVVLAGECEDNGIKYYIQDYTDKQIKTINGDFYIGVINRYNGGFQNRSKWYTDMNKFDNAIKRILKKQ